MLLLHPSPQHQQAPPGNPQATLAGTLIAGLYFSFSSSKSNPLASSPAEHLLHLWPHSQGTMQSLLAQPAFLPPIDCLISTCSSSPSPLLSVSFQYLEIHSTQDLQRHTWQEIFTIKQPIATAFSQEQDWATKTKEHRLNKGKIRHQHLEL